MDASATTGAMSPFGGTNLGRGVLPAWAPYAIVAGVGAIVAGLLAATGSFGVVLLIAVTLAVSIVVVYVMSRLVEGSRRATDREDRPCA